LKTISTKVAGFSLVEIALALAVVSFCLLTILGVFSVGLQHYHESDVQTEMVNLATLVASDLEATGSTSTTSPHFGFTIPASGGLASAIPQTVYVDAFQVGTAVGATPTSGSLYRISVFFNPPTVSGVKATTAARIWITFPALADRTPTILPSLYSDQFETTISLNRN
jgi:hypothetical protein